MQFWVTYLTFDSFFYLFVLYWSFIIFIHLFSNKKKLNKKREKKNCKHFCYDPLTKTPILFNHTCFFLVPIQRTNYFKSWGKVLFVVYFRYDIFAVFLQRKAMSKAKKVIKNKINNWIVFLYIFLVISK